MCTVDLGCKLDLHYIASHTYNVEYNPAKFNPIIMRFREPLKFTTLIFASGKIVLTGIKNEDSSKKAARIVARKIQKLGFPARFLNFRITNIVASCQLNFKPKFTKFCKQNIKFSEYVPEIFPGLIYRTKVVYKFKLKRPQSAPSLPSIPKSYGVTIIVFKLGKVIITNAKTFAQIDKAYNLFKKAIHNTTVLQGNDGW